MSNNAEINDKRPMNSPDPVITDLNMTIAQMKMSGMTKTQIANKLGLTLPDIIYHLKRVDTLMELSRKGDIGDPVNNHRARLQKNFKRMEQVYQHVLKPGSTKKDLPGWKTDFQRLKLAKDLAVDIDKGTGVFVERKEVSGQVDLLADSREMMQARLEAARQFGIEAEVEIMESTVDDNNPETDRKQGPNSSNVEPTIP